MTWQPRSRYEYQEMAHVTVVHACVGRARVYAGACRVLQYSYSMLLRESMRRVLGSPRPLCSLLVRCFWLLWVSLLGAPPLPRSSAPLLLCPASQCSSSAAMMPRCAEPCCPTHLLLWPPCPLLPLTTPLHHHLPLKHRLPQRSQLPRILSDPIREPRTEFPHPIRRRRRTR